MKNLLKETIEKIAETGIIEDQKSVLAGIAGKFGFGLPPQKQGD